jgi:hypothetical protein
MVKRQDKPRAYLWMEVALKYRHGLQEGVAEKVSPFLFRAQPCRKHLHIVVSRLNALRNSNAWVHRFWLDELACQSQLRWERGFYRYELTFIMKETAALQPECLRWPHLPKY